VGERVQAGDVELWVERHGEGPDVLLIAGLGDPAEAWQPQLDGLADRYRLTAFDNRGAARTPLPDGPLTATTMADDAAALLRALGVSSAHIAGFSMGSAVAQELALRDPGLVRSLVLVSTYAHPDALFGSQLKFWRWLPEVAPSERAFFEGFFTWVYTPRAHADGSVDQIVEEALAFPHQQSVEAFQAQVDVCLAHDTADRLRRSPRRRSSSRLSSTSSCRRASAASSPQQSRTRASRSFRGRPTSPSRRSPRSSTPESTPSGAKSTRWAERAPCLGRNPATPQAHAWNPALCWGDTAPPVRSALSCHPPAERGGRLARVRFERT
jgi:pimeloyl-ACP methyl ester carboxylesterase